MYILQTRPFHHDYKNKMADIFRHWKYARAQNSGIVPFLRRVPVAQAHLA